MNTIKTVLTALAAAVVALGAVASAQAQTTDEARAAAHRAMLERAQAQAFEPPVLEVVADGDYRVQASNEARIAESYRFHRRLQAYEAGARSTSVADAASTDTVREEAARIGREQELAGWLAYMQSSPVARVAHVRALSEEGRVAHR